MVNGHGADERSIAPSSTTPALLENLTQAILRSRKYRGLAPATVRDVVAQELGSSRKPAIVEDQARRRLHKVLASYHCRLPTEAHWATLETAYQSADRAAILAGCRAMLGLHATARERLSLLDQGYYQRLFEIVGRPQSVLDLASAYHPFALPWMDLEPGAVYHAIDNNRCFVALAERLLALENRSGTATWGDLLVDPPVAVADVAFFLMTYHCVEARRTGHGRRVLETAPARWLAVSLPVRNLGGRGADLAARYGDEIAAIAQGRGWRVDTLVWPSERLFVIEKPEFASAESVSALYGTTYG